MKRVEEGNSSNESLSNEPPKDPHLAGIWHAYGPDARISDNPIPNIVAHLASPDKLTPEYVKGRWKIVHKYWANKARRK